MFIVVLSLVSVKFFFRGGSCFRKEIHCSAVVFITHVKNAIYFFCNKKITINEKQRLPVGKDHKRSFTVQN